MAKKRWLRARHKAVFAVLRGVFGAHCAIKYNYKAVKSDIKPPFLLMCNHATALDPIFASLSFKCPVYYCSTDDLFGIPVATPLLKYLVAPIPKMKSGMDMRAIRDCITVIKEGGAVGIFPEGNRTLDGTQWEMTEAVAKFVKMCATTLVLYNIEGGYGSDPRWGVSVRKGKMRGYVKRVLTPDEFNAMTNSQLYDLICRELDVNALQGDVKFKSRRRAENIERALYMCPHCNGLSTLRSKGTRFKCDNCGKEWEYSEDLRISPSDYGDTVPQWFKRQQSELKALLNGSSDVVFADDRVALYESRGGRNKKRLAKGSVSADVNGLTFHSKRADFSFPYAKMSNLAIARKNKIEFYADGVTLQIVGDDRFCSVKYLHLFKECKK